MSGRICAECGEVHLAGENGAIYCCGSLLRAVQMSDMFPDSKYFVDMVGKCTLERTIADWQLFCSSKRNENSLKHLTNFVDNHFDKPGSVESCINPSDWRAKPDFIQKIWDPDLKQFAVALNAMWKPLSRQMKDTVRTNPSNYSLVYVPNLCIVPGGRFNELYYWDTYFIVRGLLHSGMVQTARGMIDNLLYLVREYNFVPNGGRVYYWGRSQPPLLVAMVKAYVQVTQDKKYAQKVVPILDKEMEYFMESHSVLVKGRVMYQYRDKSGGPRPEAYREDVNTAAVFKSEDDKEDLYSNLKAACESGQNFSSRWFVSSDGSNTGTLTHTKTSWIVPVDLNCIIFRNCKTIAEFYTSAGNKQRAEYYRGIAVKLIKAITAVLWNEKRGIWLDYDMRNNMPRDYFVVTNFTPLWAQAYPINNADSITESLMAYVKENNLESFPGGVPHTLYNSGEQWDYPNVWPPMMHILIEGLNNLGTQKAVELSQRLRNKWMRNAYQGFLSTGTVFDKYNCEYLGTPGAGGEYPAQSGYGWTNGMLIELLARYGEELTSRDIEEDVDIYTDEEVPVTSMAYLTPMRKANETEQTYFSPVESRGIMSFATSEQESICMPGIPQIEVCPICAPQQQNDEGCACGEQTEDVDGCACSSAGPSIDGICSVCNGRILDCPCSTAEVPEACSACNPQPADDDCPDDCPTCNPGGEKKTKKQKPFTSFTCDTPPSWPPPAKSKPPLDQGCACQANSGPTSIAMKPPSPPRPIPPSPVDKCCACNESSGRTLNPPKQLKPPSPPCQKPPSGITGCACDVSSRLPEAPPAPKPASPADKCCACEVSSQPTPQQPKTQLKPPSPPCAKTPAQSLQICPCQPNLEESQEPSEPPESWQEVDSSPPSQHSNEVESSQPVQASQPSLASRPVEESQSQKVPKPLTAPFPKLAPCGCNETSQPPKELKPPSPPCQRHPVTKCCACSMPEDLGTSGSDDGTVSCGNEDDWLNDDNTEIDEISLCMCDNDDASIEVEMIPKTKVFPLGDSTVNAAPTDSYNCPCSNNKK